MLIQPAIQKLKYYYKDHCVAEIFLIIRYYPLSSGQNLFVSSLEVLRNR